MKKINSTVFFSVFLFMLTGQFYTAFSAGLDKSKKVKDPVEMVLISGGMYNIGSDRGYPDEQPTHEVYIDSFYIDVHEVTNKQYEKFIKETHRSAPHFWRPEIDRQDEPVVGVTWHDAAAYAKWAGKRLAAEAEWEYAARGGNNSCKYPWGDEPDLSYANIDSFGILPVKSLKPNGYGLYDMIGNVWEWCSDWYDQEYYSVSPAKNPTGPEEGRYKVLRGWAWESNQYHAKVTKRYHSNPASSSYSIGFRCVKAVNKK